MEENERDLRRNRVAAIFARERRFFGYSPPFLFFPPFWRSLPMLRYVTAILNDAGVSSSVSRFAVALTGKSGFRVHTRCATPTGASRMIINRARTARWAAELRKFSNCRTNVAHECAHVRVQSRRMHTDMYSCLIYLCVSDSRRQARICRTRQETVSLSFSLSLPFSVVESSTDRRSMSRRE